MLSHAFHIQINAIGITTFMVDENVNINIGSTVFRPSSLASLTTVELEAKIGARAKA